MVRKLLVDVDGVDELNDFLEELFGDIATFKWVPEKQAFECFVNEGQQETFDLRWELLMNDEGMPEITVGSMG